MTKEQEFRKQTEEAKFEAFSFMCKKVTELEAQNERLCQSITDFQNREAGLEAQIAELKAQVEKMKCCSNCDNWNWKHNKCEKKLKGDCFKHSKWVMRNF